MIEWIVLSVIIFVPLALLVRRLTREPYPTVEEYRRYRMALPDDGYQSKANRVLTKQEYDRRKRQFSKETPKVYQARPLGVGRVTHD